MATKIATDYTDKEGYYVEKTLRITAKIATDLTDKDGFKKTQRGTTATDITGTEKN